MANGLPVLFLLDTDGKIGLLALKRALGLHYTGLLTGQTPCTDLFNEFVDIILYRTGIMIAYLSYPVECPPVSQYIHLIFNQREERNPVNVDLHLSCLFQCGSRIFCVLN